MARQLPYSAGDCLPRNDHRYGGENSPPGSSVPGSTGPCPGAREGRAVREGSVRWVASRGGCPRSAGIRPVGPPGPLRRSVLAGIGRPRWPLRRLQGAAQTARARSGPPGGACSRRLRRVRYGVVAATAPGDIDDGARLESHFRRAARGRYGDGSVIYPPDDVPAERIERPVPGYRNQQVGRQTRD